jgi:hypothetical protein
MGVGGWIRWDDKWVVSKEGFEVWDGEVARLRRRKEELGKSG